MKGTMSENEGVTYLFVGLKKDKEKRERNNYKDKFLSASMFQWESENNTTVSNKIGEKLLNTSIVHLFVRKMDSEDGITLPFTYFGTGHFTNMRDSQVEIFDKKTLSILKITFISLNLYNNKSFLRFTQSYTVASLYK